MSRHAERDVRVPRRALKRLTTRTRITAPLTLAAAICVYGATGAAQQPPERLTASFSDQERPGTLLVQLVNGSINVRGMTRTDASIGLRPHAGDRPLEGSAGAGRTTQGRGFTVTEENNQMSIGVNGATQRIDLEIVVPMRTNLRLSTLNDGDIIVDNVTGEVEVNSTNGLITTTNIAGSIVARSINGNIRSAMTQVTADRPMSFTSFTGMVDVMLPFSLRANLKLRSDQGDVFTDFSLQLRPGTRTPVEETQRAGARFRTDATKALYGIVNGGGPDIELRSFAGNVFARKGS